MAGDRGWQVVAGEIKRLVAVRNPAGQVLEEVRRGEITFVAGLGGEVFLEAQVVGRRQPRLEFRIATTGTPYRALQATAVALTDGDIEAGPHLVHARTRHLLGCSEADEEVRGCFQAEVHAGQEIVVARSPFDGRPGRVACKGIETRRTLVGAHVLEADIAAQRHRPQVCIKVGLQVQGVDGFVHAPVLVGDIPVVLEYRVVETRLVQGIGVEGGQATDAANPERARLTRERRGTRSGAGNDAKLGFDRALVLAAVGAVEAELDAADEARIEGASRIQAQRGQLVSDFEVLDVTILAPAAGIDQAQVGGIVQVGAEGVFVVTGAGVQNNAQRACAVVRGQASIGL